MFTGTTLNSVHYLVYWHNNGSKYKICLMARQNGMTIFMLYKLFTGTTPNILKSIGTTIDHQSIERYQKVPILMA